MRKLRKKHGKGEELTLRFYINWKSKFRLLLNYVKFESEPSHTQCFGKDRDVRPGIEENPTHH